MARGVQSATRRTHYTVTALLMRLLYIEVAISFLIDRKRTVNLGISACDVIPADYTIIMSRSRVIMSCMTAAHDFHIECLLSRHFFSFNL